MATIEQHQEVIQRLNAQVSGTPDYKLLYNYYSEANYLLEDCPEERKLAFSVTKFVKDWCYNLIQMQEDDFYNLYWKAILFEARNKVLDSYLLYLEKNRQKQNRFYEPRRKCFQKIGIIQALQDILDDKLDLLTFSIIPGGGKTTLLKMFHSAICGWYPNDYNLFYSHSGDITRMYYDGMFDILMNEDEYTWREIFPDCKVTSTNAKLEQININNYKPFPNVQCTSIGAKNAGKVRASKFLLCDDLVGNQEEALNRNILDKLWSNAYTVDARQRKVTGCKEIHIATRWSVYDVIGRLQRMYEENDRCKFIAVPDIDPDTGESNFLYDINGFTVEFFHDQEKLMDDVSYRCLYKNDPVEREGLLFPEDSLRRYFNLPDGTPTLITGQCDPKGKGKDFMFMPVVFRYGTDYYVVDAVCNKESDYEQQYEALADMIVRYQVQSVEFESNMGGDRVAEEVNKRVLDKGWICNITDAPTEKNKEARILQCAAWIKQHVIFKDRSLYPPRSGYNTMMKQLTGYTVVGRNKNDDIPDCLSNFALRVTGANKVATVEAIQNPFRRGVW